MSLQKMFSKVVGTYDIINRIVTFGLDSQWRRAASLECVSNNPKIILDIGCGTGDLTFQLEDSSENDPTIFGLDFSDEMIRDARKKKLIRNSKIIFIKGDVANLPFSNSSVDCITASFSFRNLVYKNPKSEDYLKEILRVLKPEGRFVIIESSQPQSYILRELFHFYALKFVPLIGWVVSRQRGAYQYLGTSMANFPNPDEVTRLLKRNGFQDVSFRPLSRGLAGIHIAFKR
jgi:demethylmenaquinone methyltransferase/2-methoxy-6-polyprenyl-1,4-benzoquinol methylase